MKKQLFILTFLLSNFIGFTQEYVVTPDGLKDKSNVENSYLVIEAPDKSTAELYQNAIRYVNENYKNPEEVIKGKTENEYLRFETYVPQFTKVNNSGAKLEVSMKYTTELRFKDGKVRFEITALSITADNGGRSVEFSGSIWKGYPIYNQKNGELRLPETKSEIENYFNTKVIEITNFLLDKRTKKDDW
jgi:predicted nucleotidyltransferase